jgi:hypothetical protein
MKTIMRISTYAAMAAMLVTVVLVDPGAAKTKIRFNGFLQGAEIDTPVGTTLTVDGSATGLATDLGEFTMTYDVTVNLVTGRGIGSAQFTAANGDTITTTLLGQGEPTDTPGINSIVEINTVTGGTGQFAGASGTIIVERLVDLPSGFTSGAVRGKVTTRD